MSKHIKNSNVLINTVMLYGLTAAKLLFPLLTLPYLTRILSVEAYAATAYVKSLMTYGQLIVDFGFMLSATKDIVNNKGDDSKISQILGETSAAKLMLASASFIVMTLLTFAIPILRSRRAYTLLSFVPVILSIFLFDYLFRGIEKMQVITIRFVVMKAISTLFTFVLVKSDADLLLIPILDILSSCVAVCLVVFELRKLGINKLSWTFSGSIKKIKESSIFFASSVATTAFGALNTLLIGAILPESDVAYWSVSMQLISAVQSMYAPIIDGVYPEMIKSKNMKLIKTLLLIFMPVILIGSVFSYAVAPFVLSIVGGAKYIAAKSVFRALIPMLIFSFPSQLFGWPTLGAIGKEKYVTFTTIIGAATQITALLILFATGHFSLLFIAIARCVTEAVMMGLRVFGLLVFQKENVYES